MSSTQATVESAAPSSSQVAIAEGAGPGRYHEWRRSLAGIARAALGGFADGCLVHALDLDVAWWCEGAFAGEADAELTARLARLSAGLPACIDEVVAAARPLLVEDANRADEQPARLLWALDASSLVIVPVWAEGRVIAALTFLRCAPRQGFQRDDLALAEALAATAAVAIVNAAVCARERQAYAALAVSEARFRALVSASAQVVWTTDADGTVAEDSPEWRAFTGQSREQWKELGWLGALHPDDRPRAVAAWETALRDRAAMEVEYRTRRPDGSFCWTVARAAPVFDEVGRLREWVGTNTDISERKRFEAALQGSEARLRCALAVAEARSFRRTARVHQQIEAIIDAVPFPISCIDASGRYTYVSRGYELWFGQPRKQFVGESVHEVVGAEAYEQLRPMVEGALNGERQQFELTLPYARGGTREVAATYVPQFDEDGRPSGFVAVILDVSEHKALVESLRRSLRFSEEFVGILGHDLRSPLSAISLTSAVLLGQLGDHSAAKSVLRIERSARRMARMIEQILDFTQARLGGGIPVRPAPMDLAILADEIVVEVRSGALHPIELAAEGDARGHWDPDRLGQVFSNLLANAVHHGCKDTPVRVEVRGTEPDSVQLTVWNAGVIPACVLPAVFDRFQRGDADPASRSQGLGLGLYIVRQIVLAHGGTIEVRSSEEAGTRFAVVLPRTTAGLRRVGYA